ncbi:hypothetical protein PSTG_12838 [Puccinia striiformis f. sp. tritici PST-78]|uniref:Uncharacterized protein n=1 Tax=Puccinia striiformis f. sp. tritici PST-78 TaxID=1165861 RepID=A0A0L0V3G3_9BASI|nr:hypothetical protein PSTG_12838 [Puccinia striiformis f. sp. tritici PST-78]
MATSNQSIRKIVFNSASAARQTCLPKITQVTPMCPQAKNVASGAVLSHGKGRRQITWRSSLKSVRAICPIGLGFELIFFLCSIFRSNKPTNQLLRHILPQSYDPMVRGINLFVLLQAVTLVIAPRVAIRRLNQALMNIDNRSAPNIGSALEDRTENHESNICEACSWVWCEQSFFGKWPTCTHTQLRQERATDVWPTTPRPSPSPPFTQAGPSGVQHIHPSPITDRPTTSYAVQNEQAENTCLICLDDFENQEVKACQIYGPLRRSILLAKKHRLEEELEQLTREDKAVTFNRRIALSSLLSEFNRRNPDMR